MVQPPFLTITPEPPQVGHVFLLLLSALSGFTGKSGTLLLSFCWTKCSLDNVSSELVIVRTHEEKSCCGRIYSAVHAVLDLVILASLSLTYTACLANEMRSTKQGENNTHEPGGRITSGSQPNVFRGWDRLTSYLLRTPAVLEGFEPSISEIVTRPQHKLQREHPLLYKTFE